MFPFFYWLNKNRFYGEILKKDPMKEAIEKCLNAVNGPIIELARNEKDTEKFINSSNL
ncbi:MAG: hypothetical protein NUV46_03290 [Nanoarchaeota archaeon]|nr:hypothetical protein [Nanoarchaeota archaeon]